MEQEITNLKKENELKRAEINKVEGYYPQSELVYFPIINENNEEVGQRAFLRLSKKEEWFYLKYPTGVIRNVVLESNEKYVKVQSSIYADYHDHDEHYLRRETVIMSVNELDPYVQGKELMEIIGITENKAKAKAESTALYKAGFGLQFETPDDISSQMDMLQIEDLKKAPSLPLPPQIKNPPGRKGSEPVNSKVEKKREMDMKIQRSGNFVPEPDSYEQCSFFENESINEKLQKALMVSSPSPAYKNLGDAVAKKPQFIQWIIKGGRADKEIVEACKFIMEHDERMKNVPAMK